MKKVAIIGPNTQLCSTELYDFGRQLGNSLAQEKLVIVCGGLGGFMEAVCKGAKESPQTFYGQTIGVLPGEDASAANPYVDLAIPTGLGIARNLIIIRTADIIIAAAGGAGTLSEIAFAWQHQKKVLCITRFDGWAKELAGRDLDKRESGLLVPVDEIDDVIQLISN